MEKNYICPKCGQFPLKYSQSLDLYFCTECLSVYEKFCGELEPKKYECECRYNKFVDCKVTARIAGECSRCGWNPKVSKDRLERRKA